MSGVEIEREVFRGFDEAGSLLARGLRDNPMTRAVYRGDAEERFAINHRMYRALLKARMEPFFCAQVDARMIGVVAASPPNECRPGFLGSLRMIPPVPRIHPRHLRRFIAWTGALGQHEPEAPHWHLGPVAVDPAWQGKGVGTALMTAFIEKVDQRSDYTYLETDRLSVA